jgi:YfiH family protein
VNGPELSFELPGGACARFTSRADGSFALAADADERERALNRGRMLALTGAEGLARGRQVHRADVRRVLAPPADGEESPVTEADGQSTALRGVALAVVSADCLPVALAGEGAVAMVHAGWRGLAAGVLEEGVRAIEELDGGGPIAAVIGPGAGKCCYEVGPEVHAAFGDRRGEAWTLDLRGLAHARLSAAGVESIRDVDACTICDSRFYSHRREGSRAGRQAGIAWRS